jgi:hypothetical protein
MKKQLLLHIGTHKTGSTSLQKFLLDNATVLVRHGVGLYRGQFHEANHVELQLAAMRYDRDSFGKQRLASDTRIDADFTKQVATRVRRFISSCREPRILFTSEGLSLLRHDDEIDRLRTILDAFNAEVSVVLYLRNKEDFLQSYIRQLHKVATRTEATDYWSALYVEPDTWLTDYESLISAYERGFGAKCVTTIDYDAEMLRVGNIIPSFLNVLEIPSTAASEVDSYFLNQSGGVATTSAISRWGRNVKAAWRAWTRRKAA